MATMALRRSLCAVLLLTAAGCLGTEDEPHTEVKQIESATVPFGCAHSPCSDGGVLVPGCGPNSCVTSICNWDPYCCNVRWDSTCVGEVKSICHERCDCGTVCTPYPTLPDPFYPDACSCVATVCNRDSWCSQQNWDTTCMNEATSWCPGVTCP